MAFAAFIPLIAAGVSAIGSVVASGIAGNTAENIAHEQALAYRMASANASNQQKIRSLADSNLFVGGVIAAVSLSAVLAYSNTN